MSQEYNSSRRTDLGTCVMIHDPHIIAVASAFPDTLVDRETAADTLERLFPEEEPEFVRTLVERCGVETRFIAPTIAEILAPASFTERNAQYCDAALSLSANACRAALARARIAADEIDAIVDVSCTGISIPALDVSLSAELGLRSDVRRIPITESGCAAGALALGLAAALARSGMTVLVVAVELCSLSLVRGDKSRTNLIASVLFGDGAAAAVVAPRGTGPRIAAVGSHLIPDTNDIMGFHVGDHGLRIFLDRELPGVLLENLPAVQRGFLERHGRSVRDIGLHLIHPGGRRVMDAYAHVNGLSEHDMRHSRAALQRYGNLSSASVLTVLEIAVDSGIAPGTEAFLMAVGPGLSVEMLLLAFDA